VAVSNAGTRVRRSEVRELDTSTRTSLLRARVPALLTATIYKAVGCKECRMTGYTGRRAIFEMMTMSSPIREILLRGGSSLEIKEAAKKDGMKTLIEDGWRVVALGITTPSEVLRVSKDEGAEGYLVE